MRQGIAWVEGRPETARPFNGWLHRQWVEFSLGIHTYWPNPLQARRVWSFRGADPWTRYPVRTAEGLERIMRESRARAK